jgi:hypothetical protein
MEAECHSINQHYDEARIAIGASIVGEETVEGKGASDHSNRHPEGHPLPHG